MDNLECQSDRYGFYPVDSGEAPEVSEWSKGVMQLWKGQIKAKQHQDLVNNQIKETKGNKE